MSDSSRQASRGTDAVAVVAGILAATGLVLFVHAQARPIVPAPAAASSATAVAPADRLAATFRAPSLVTPSDALPTPGATAVARAPGNVRASATSTAAAGRQASASGTRVVGATPTESELVANGSATPGPTSTGPGVALLDPPAPYFTMSRPFTPDHAVEASRYYPYGTRGRGEYLLHHGVDIGNANGTPVLAVGDGEVVYAGDDLHQPWGPTTDFYGNVVVIRHATTVGGQAISTLYGHLSQVEVATGQPVAAGDVIGLVGMAGIALGPHLHLEVRLGDPQDYEATRNAELFLAPLAGRGTLLGRVTDAAGAVVPNVRVALFRQDGAGETYYGETTTYPAQHVHPSEAFGETFVFADIPGGPYTLYAQVAGRQSSAAVEVTDGGTFRVELQP